jgi:hypothetical protein
MVGECRQQEGIAAHTDDVNSRGERRIVGPLVAGEIGGSDASHGTAYEGRQAYDCQPDANEGSGVRLRADM